MFYQTKGTSPASSPPRHRGLKRDSGPERPLDGGTPGNGLKNSPPTWDRGGRIGFVGWNREVVQTSRHRPLAPIPAPLCARPRALTSMNDEQVSWPTYSSMVSRGTNRSSFSSTGACGASPTGPYRAGVWSAGFWSGGVWFVSTDFGLEGFFGIDPGFRIGAGF